MPTVLQSFKGLFSVLRNPTWVNSRLHTPFENVLPVEKQCSGLDFLFRFSPVVFATLRAGHAQYEANSQRYDRAAALCKSPLLV
jgi:hypothetical protein